MRPDVGVCAGAVRDSTAALQRHQLVHLSDDAWTRLLVAAEGDACREGIAHWAACDGPLVVARQDARQPTMTVAVGLPLPALWGRKRLRLQVPLGQVVRVEAFPPAREVLPLLPPADRPAVSRLCRKLAALNVDTRAYGSFGWQHLTGLDHVHDDSDLDLLIAVADAETADHAVRYVCGFERSAPRLDGELVFGDGTAVAWREWQDWRCGRTAQLLLKRTEGPCLARGGEWLEEATAVRA